MAQLNLTLTQEEILELLKTPKNDAFKVLLQNALNAFITAESDEKIQAKPHEQTENRTDYRNGSRERALHTRLGTIILTVPRHREEPFHTMVFNNYQRSESALILTMAEMVVSGVSTRKVSKVMETLCGTSFSKSSVSKACETLDAQISTFSKRRLSMAYPFVVVDATYFKVRETQGVIPKALFIAMGISELGKREIIGFETYENESTANWSEFFKHLKARGLTGVKMITSDANEGILRAMMEHFPNVPWQRCHYHFTKNIVEKAPKSYQDILRSELRIMFKAPDLESAQKKMQQIADNYRDSAERAIECLEKGFIDSMTNLQIPKRLRTEVRTSNHVERINKELKRRSNAIGIFPNDDSLIRLMGSILLEVNEKWASKERMFSKPTLSELEKVVPDLSALAQKQHTLLFVA